MNFILTTSAKYQKPHPLIFIRIWELKLIKCLLRLKNIIKKANDASAWLAFPWFVWVISELEVWLILVAGGIWLVKALLTIWCTYFLDWDIFSDTSFQSVIFIRNGYPNRIYAVLVFLFLDPVIQRSPNRCKQQLGLCSILISRTATSYPNLLSRYFVASFLIKATKHQDTRTK